MKISELWLKSWVEDAPEQSKTIAEQLTMHGLEVDSITPVTEQFNGVVVGQVLESNKHPDADKLSCCKVDIGDEQPLSIVCGASNVRAGLKVPVATIGATLPGNFKIKKTKLRGELSEGMICAASELGLTASAGIMELPPDAPVGVDFREYWQLDDHIIDIELTPNRGDCLSVRGLAQELAVINRCQVKWPELNPVPATLSDRMNIQLKAPAYCPRYASRIIRNIRMNQTTPVWMQERLGRSGIRSLNPLVDVTNYVMLELGQPMHVFDHEKLSGQLEVRCARTGEELVILDGSTVVLSPDILVIADQQQAQAVAGVMGGHHSAVSGTTKGIVLESAYFDPVQIRKMSQQLNIISESSYRFSRGVDFDLQKRAIERATALLLEIVGGEAGTIEEIIDYQHLPVSPTILLRKSQLKRIVDMDISNQEIVTILESLGMKVVSQNNENEWEVCPPSYRFDIAQEIDLIEEVVRIWGFQKITPQLVPMPRLMPKSAEEEISLPRLKRTLADRGYHEVVTYSFVDHKIQQSLDRDHEPITLLNPIAEDMSVMCTTLWSGLIPVMQYNVYRQCERVRIFETGRVYIKEAEGHSEHQHLGLLITGAAMAPQWSIKDRLVDFYDMKGDVTALFEMSKIADQVDFKPSEHPALHPGQAAEIYVGDTWIGRIGALHPELVQQFDLKQSVFLAELSLKRLMKGKIPKYIAIGKFPATRRDLAFIIDDQTRSDAIVGQMRKSAGPLLRHIEIFDVYQGGNIGDGKKSIALGLTFQDPCRTLIDDEINKIIQIIVGDLKEKFQAQLRA